MVLMMRVRNDAVPATNDFATNADSTVALSAIAHGTQPLPPHLYSRTTAAYFHHLSDGTLDGYICGVTVLRLQKSTVARRFGFGRVVFPFGTTKSSTTYCAKHSKM